MRNRKTVLDLLSPSIFFKRLTRLIRLRIFIFLTILGHAYLVFGTVTLYYLERGVNPQIHSLLDTLFWSVETVTTVGFGSVVPVTNAGKVLGICMMIMGSILFWSYTALFATAIVAPELKQVEDEMHDIEKALHKDS